MVSKSFKVGVIGDPGVGKTTFFDYLLNHIPSAIKTTDTTVDVIQQIDGEKIKLTFQDYPGLSHRSRNVCMPYSNTHAMLVMYSLSESETINSIRLWIEECNSYVEYQNSPDRNGSYVWAIVGNKCDKDLDFSDDEEAETRLRAFTNLANPLTINISSTIGYNVRNLLKMLTERLLDANSPLEQMNITTTHSSQVHSPQPRRRRGCCLWCFNC